MDISKILNFVSLTHAFQQTKRSVYVTGENRLEHDAEHSYQLALTAWYIASSNKLELDTDLLVKYAICHDLAEIYAGDTPNFGEGVEMKHDKVEREEASLHRLQQEFPEFIEIFHLIEQYEKREDKESKFIYALDKLISPLNIYLDNGKSWFKNGVTLEELIANKRPRIESDPAVLDLFDQLVEMARAKEVELFPNKQL